MFRTRSIHGGGSEICTKFGSNLYHLQELGTNMKTVFKKQVVGRWTAVGCPVVVSCDCCDRTAEGNTFLY
jgi:hypothetical protein